MLATLLTRPWFAVDCALIIRMIIKEMTRFTSSDAPIGTYQAHMSWSLRSIQHSELDATPCESYATVTRCDSRLSVDSMITSGVPHANRDMAMSRRSSGTRSAKTTMNVLYRSSAVERGSTEFVRAGKEPGRITIR